jgi:hypothetical protein
MGLERMLVRTADLSTSLGVGTPQGSFSLAGLRGETALALFHPGLLRSPLPRAPNIVGLRDETALALLPVRPIQGSPAIHPFRNSPSLRLIERCCAPDDLSSRSTRSSCGCHMPRAHCGPGTGKRLLIDALQFIDNRRPCEVLCRVFPVVSSHLDTPLRRV